MSHLDEGQLHELLDGELDQAARQAVEAHLAACAECRSRLDEARGLADEAEQLIGAVEVPPPSGTSRAVASATTSGFRPRTAFRWRSLAWAASLFLAVGLGWYSSRLPSTTPSQPAVDGLASVPEDVTQKDSAAAENKQEESAAKLVPNDARERRSQANRVPAQPPPRAVLADREAVSADSLARTDFPAAAGSMALQQRRAEAPVAAPAPQVSAELGNAVAPSGARDAAKPAEDLGYSRKAYVGFRPVEMEEAVRTLGGAIRLLDGLTPSQVLLGPGGLAIGLDPEREAVRVVYQDPPGRELWLDQQRMQLHGLDEGRPLSAGRATQLLPGDTLQLPMAEGRRSLSWIGQDGFQLTLTGFLGADSLRAVARRVR